MSEKPKAKAAEALKKAHEKLEEESRHYNKVLRIIEALPENVEPDNVSPFGYMTQGSIQFGTDTAGGYQNKYKGVPVYQPEDVAKFLELLPPVTPYRVKNGYATILPLEAIDQKDLNCER